MPCTTNTFDAALFAFQQGDYDTRQTFPANESFKKKLLSLARREARDLSSDLIEDVIQRTWELLLRSDLKCFDPKRGSANSYLRQVIKRAATDVRAEYTPPGQRTRLNKNNDSEVIYQIPALSLDAELEYSDEETFTLHDLIHTQPDLFEIFQKKDEAEQLLERARTSARSEVYEALNLIYTEELNLTQAAQKIELHRSTLRRHIDRWVSLHQLALAA